MNDDAFWFQSFQKEVGTKERNLDYWNNDFNHFYGKLTTSFYCRNLKREIEGKDVIAEIFLKDCTLPSPEGYFNANIRLSRLDFFRIMYNGKCIVIIMKLKDDVALFCCLLRGGFTARPLLLSKCLELCDDWTEVSYDQKGDSYYLQQHVQVGKYTKGAK